MESGRPRLQVESQLGTQIDAATSYAYHEFMNIGSRRVLQRMSANGRQQRTPRFEFGYEEFPNIASRPRHTDANFLFRRYT
jgi:hypothetical protein